MIIAVDNVVEEPVVDARGRWAPNGLYIVRAYAQYDSNVNGQPWNTWGGRAMTSDRWELSSMIDRTRPQLVFIGVFILWE